ncbi:hypothetical protein [Zunongwangia endophytica]|uniref:HTH araC/xylS-type domain-containing protein n=1 Tax=Zunongwangia endophytica TaxID=1808945 RepID=A0ABV8H4Q3_9FLAO|nr:hypothetical protein [Zunongwangia endophytica]MDN3594462.1 hypothetical protein [Zunongwangia endophytica]
MPGQIPPQGIHEKLIEIAKVRLSTTQETIGEIAYQLGYTHPQSFYELLKRKAK